MFWKADSALTALRMNIMYLNNGVNHDSLHRPRLTVQLKNAAGFLVLPPKLTS